MSISPEARFHSKLYDKLDDYIHANPTPFDSVRIEEQNEAGRADVVVRSHLTGSLVIEVKRDDKYPLEKQFVKQARDYADDIGAEFFATCTSNDFFLFDYNGELALTDVEFYYLDLREADPHDPTFGGVIPKILQAVQYLSEKGVLPNQRERDRITGLLRSFHTAIWPTYYALAEATYEKNAAFTNNFDEWVAENDYTGLSLDEQLELAAKQHAYLLTNKILFYEVVREKTPEPIGTQSGFKLDSLHEGVTVESIDTHVRRQFGRIVEEIDYEPIFNDGSSLFASFPENKRTQHAVNDLLQSIEAQAVTDLDEDLLGELYEELIPEDERKALGQFYTPPKIAEAIVQWAITPQSDGSIPQVLDPASGSGTFSVEAYKRIAELCPAAGHQEIVDHILAVDVNKFPLHLTALNLASRNITERTDRLHARNDSFFDIDPNSRTLSTYGNGGFDGAVTGRYDAAVANPPYIRQENLYPNKEHFRHHLKNYRVNDATPYYDGKKKLSKKSDAYIYFVTYALQFLREGGRLGFIIPAKWLDVQYGEPFQQFLFDNTKIHAVVDFSARAFEDALVNTALLLVEKCSDERERNANVTDFIRVREAMSPTDLVDTVEFQRTVPDDRSLEFEKREGYSIVSVDQSDLNEQGPRKLGYYLYAPRPIIDLLESDLFVPLAELAVASFGCKTGANKFFFLTDEDVAEWDIDERFLKPAIKSIRDVDTIRTDPIGVGWHILDIHDYVERALNSTDTLETTSEASEIVKSRLREDGYHDLLSYVRYGEAQGYHERSTCAARNVWFDLGELSIPDVLHPRFYGEEVSVIANHGRLCPSNNLVCIDGGSEKDLLSAVLNSTLYKVTLEVWGTTQGGGALNLETWEVKSAPIPNYRILDKQAKQIVAEAGERRLSKGESEQQLLDEAVHDAFGIPMKPAELRRLKNLLVEQRVGGAANTEVLLREISEFDEYDLSGFVTNTDATVAD